MGPLNGIKVLEFAGIGPAPFCAMMLSDMGADVLRIDRKGETRFGKFDITTRGRSSVAIDIKSPEDIKIVLKFIENADALIEGFRPGVMERLGLGPQDCCKRNEKLVYGRMTGWGQEGPLASAAGHDINYIALSGALHAIGRPGEPPVPPLNLVGDFGGGAMMLAFGLVCALFETQHSGKGQVVDAAMIDGVALLMSMMYGAKSAGKWNNERGTNRLDGGAPFYSVYECADGKYISIGSLEPQFYALLLEKCGIDDHSFQDRLNVFKWPELKGKFAAIFKSKSRSEWCNLMEGTDVCFAPVLDMDEAPHHPHNQARKTFIEIDSVIHPAPVPRFSRTAPEIQGPPVTPGAFLPETMLGWGLTKDDIDLLIANSVI